MHSINIPTTGEIQAWLGALTMAEIGALARASGVGESTIVKIRYGKTVNPGIETVRALLPHLEVLRAARAAAREAQAEARAPDGPPAFRDTEAPVAAERRAAERDEQAGDELYAQSRVMRDPDYPAAPQPIARPEHGGFGWAEPSVASPSPEFLTARRGAAERRSGPLVVEPDKRVLPERRRSTKSER